MTIHVRYSL